MLYSRAGTYPPRQPMLYAEDFSPNTPQGACPNCHGLGRVYEVTEKSMVPDDSLTIRERAIAAWPPAWHGQNLRDILVTLGHDVDMPWRELPKKTRDWILFTDEQPTVPVYPGFTPAETRTALRRKTEPAYMGTFTGARNYVLHTFATTQSPLMKKRVSRFMIGAICPACRGKRLKREALAVTFAGLDIGTLARLPLSEMAEVLKPAACGPFRRDRGRRRARRASRADADRDARRGARGHGAPRRRRRLGARRRARRAPDAQPLGRKADRRAAHRRRPGRTHRDARVARPRLSLARPQHADALARRAAAAAPGDADPLEPVRRRLRPRRADRGAASEGRRRPALGARCAEAIGQLDLRRRARPGDDAARRLDRRRRSRRRRERRPRPLQRAARRPRRRARVAHRALPVRRAPSRAGARRASRRAGSSCAASRATTCTTSTRAFRSAC